MGGVCVLSNDEGTFVKNRVIQKSKYIYLVKYFTKGEGMDKENQKLSTYVVN